MHTDNLIEPDILFGWVADRYGRRTIFTCALVWYAAATAIMALQRTRLDVNLWRFVTGVGWASN